MFSIRNKARAFAVALCLCGVSLAQSPPSFVSGDVGLLECRVVDVRADTEYCALLTVEVANADPAAAEPLEFQIEVQDKKGAPPRVETFHRTALPRFRRFGRSIPPGGRQKYVLATTLIAKRPQYAVRVAQASWHSGAEVARPELLTGKPEQIQLTSLAGTFPVTEVELKNPFDRELDALFLVTFTQPKDLVELRGVHLAPGASLRWALSTLAGTKTYLEPERNPGCTMKATAFELVDWSLAAPVDPAAGAGMLRGPYEAWARWPEPFPAVSGGFRCNERRQKYGTKDYEVFDVAGRFTLDSAGNVAVKIESGTGTNAVPELMWSFAGLRRESWEAVIHENVLQPIGVDRVELRGPAFGFLRPSGAELSAGGSEESSGTHLDVQVRGGRIVGSGTGDGQRTAWETRELGGGYVVVRTRDASTDKTIAYQQVGALLMPQRTTVTVTFGDNLYSTTELTLSDLKTEGVEPLTKAVPAGPGAAALSTLWNASYRFPTTPIKTTGTFEVTHPGTDLIWNGVKKLKGSLEMTGIGRNMQALHLEFSGKLAPQEELALVGAFRDRLLIWYGSDFNDRPAFEEFFAGATIDAPGADGSFRIEGNQLARVLAEGGLVRGWVDAHGSQRRFTYQDFDGRNAVTKIETTHGGAGDKGRDAWTETVTITLAKVGEHLLPAQLKLERIFGKEWGPETVVLKGLKLQ